MLWAPFVVAALVLASTLVWVARLAGSTAPLAVTSATLLGAALLVNATVAVVGLLVARGRWTRRLAVAVVLVQLSTAPLLERTPLWFLGVGTSTLALLALTGPWLTGWLRRRPRPADPPSAAVLLAVGLLFLPIVVALAAPRGLAIGQWLLVGTAAASALGYSRAYVLALWTLRLAFPILGALALFGLPPAGAAALGLAEAILTRLAWSRHARQAITPLPPIRGHAVAIPPELVPPDVLGVAGRETTGRRIRRRP